MKSNIEKFGLIEPGDRIVVGVSGGADSVCLLALLSELRETGELPFFLRCVHVNHGLRDTADRDEAYVEKLCELLNVPVTVVRVSVREEVIRSGKSVEEAARNLRYEALFRACRAWDQEALSEGRTAETGTGSKVLCRGAKIAVAHHLEDQAETVLFRLCRGTSLAGAAGMRPSQALVIRPLLSFTRGEIEAALSERDLTFCTDETNDDVHYARNCIRKRVLPVLQDNVNSAAVRHLASFAQEAAETEDYLRRETERAFESCVENGTCLRLQLTQWRKLHPLMQRRVLYQALLRTTGRQRDLEAVHVEALRKLCERGGYGELDLPYGVRAIKSYDVLALRDTEISEDECAAKEQYRMRIIKFCKDMSAIPRGQCTKWLDYDKICLELSEEDKGTGQLVALRRRRPGDRITVRGDGASKTLARFFIDEKIPREERERVFPFAGNEVLWVPGHRISERYKVSQDTVNVLELSCDIPDSNIN